MDNSTRDCIQYHLDLGCDFGFVLRPIDPSTCLIHVYTSGLTGSEDYLCGISYNHWHLPLVNQIDRSSYLFATNEDPHFYWLHLELKEIWQGPEFMPWDWKRVTIKHEVNRFKYLAKVWIDISKDVSVSATLGIIGGVAYEPGKDL